MNKLIATLVYSGLLAVLAVTPLLAQGASRIVSVASFQRGASLPAHVTSPSTQQAISSPLGYFEAINETTYVVGPDDFFQITFAGQTGDFVVNSEGYLVLHDMAPIHVAGETLFRAREIIIQSLSRQYRGDKIYVTLARAKPFQVSVSGEFVRPGFLRTEPGSRVSHVVERAGGFSYLATRELILTSATGEQRPVDLAGYYKTGDVSLNPPMNQGDRLHAPGVDFSGDIVQVRDRELLRAISLQPEDDLEAVLNRFYSFNTSAEWRYARVFRDGAYILTVSRQDAAGVGLKSGDLVEVHAQTATIYVGGSVALPGTHPYDPRFTLIDYVAMSGVTVNTSRNFERATIVSVDGVARSPQAPNEPILPGDHIWVPRTTEAAARDYIALVSAVSSLAVAVATFFVLLGTQ